MPTCREEMIDYLLALAVVRERLLNECGEADEADQVSLLSAYTVACQAVRKEIDETRLRLVELPSIRSDTAVVCGIPDCPTCKRIGESAPE